MSDTTRSPQDEDTSPGDHETTLYQQILSTCDALTPPDRELLLILVNSFASMNAFERDMLVNTALKLAGL